MARYFNIDGKVARAAIAKGEFQDFFYLLLKNQNSTVERIQDINFYALTFQSCTSQYHINTENSHFFFYLYIL